MDAQTYSSLVESGEVIRYTATATATLLVYDHLITLPDELRYIWDSPLSFYKFTLLTNRYLPFITMGLIFYMDVFATSFCERLLLIGGIFFCTGFVVAEGILLMRIYAIWSRSRTILFLLVLLFTPSLLVAYYGTIRFVLLASRRTLATKSHGCIFTFGNRMAYGSLVALVLFETLMLGLLISRYYRVRKVKSTLVELLCKDGAFFYVSVLALTGTNLVLLRFGSPSLCYFFLITQGALHSILSNRLVLRLRGAGTASWMPHTVTSEEQPRTLDSSPFTDNISTAYFSSIVTDGIRSP